MRWLIAIAGAVLVVATLGTPSPAPSPVDAKPEPAEAAFGVCPVDGGRGLVPTIGLASVVSGPVTVTPIVASGSEATSITVDLAGGARFSPQSGAPGVTVLESRTPETAAAVLTVSDGGVGWARCSGRPDPIQIVSGLSTAQGDRSLLILANPFTADARVSVGTSSEVGVDSLQVLEDIVVPAGNTVVEDLTDRLRLRTSLAATVRVTDGSVVALGRVAHDGAFAEVEGVAPAAEWWIPIPEFDAMSGFISVASPAPVDIGFQVDTYGDDGVIEAYGEASTIPAGEHLSIEVSSLPPLTRAVRVIATAPVVAGLEMEGDGWLAAGPGASDPAPRWFLPGVSGAAGGEGVAWVVNTSGVDAEIAVQSLMPNSNRTLWTVPAEGALKVSLPDPTAGYLVESATDLVVARTLITPFGARAYVLGRPVDG